MEIEIYARRRDFPVGIKSYKRTLNADIINRRGNHYQISFNTEEGKRFRDFTNKIVMQVTVGGCYLLRIVEKEKWFETRLIRQHELNNSTFNIEVFKEDSVLSAHCIEM